MNLKHSDLYKNWQLLAEGEKQGLYECFNLFYDDLYRFGLALYKDPALVKEGIHNLFLELWGIKHKLADVKNVQQYTLTIFKRVLYKTYQQWSNHQGKTFSGLNPADREEEVEQSYEAILIESQQDEHLKLRLKKAMNQLSPRQKEIIRLRYFDQAGFKSIAEQTGLTERTVYNTLYNAIKVLREVICLSVFYKLLSTMNKT